MKKAISIISIVVIIILTSCGKDYTCACSFIPHTGTGSLDTTIIYYHTTKSKATKECAAEGQTQGLNCSIR